MTWFALFQLVATKMRVINEVLLCGFYFQLFQTDVPDIPSGRGSGQKQRKFSLPSVTVGEHGERSSEDRKQTFHLFMCHSVAAVCTVHYCLICLERVVLNVLGLV